MTTPQKFKLYNTGRWQFKSDPINLVVGRLRKNSITGHQYLEIFKENGQIKSFGTMTRALGQVLAMFGYGRQKVQERLNPDHEHNIVFLQSSSLATGQIYDPNNIDFCQKYYMRTLHEVLRILKSVKMTMPVRFLAQIFSEDMENMSTLTRLMLKSKLQNTASCVSCGLAVMSVDQNKKIKMALPSSLPAEEMEKQTIADAAPICPTCILDKFYFDPAASTSAKKLIEKFVSSLENKTLTYDAFIKDMTELLMQVVAMDGGTELATMGTTVNDAF